MLLKCGGVCQQNCVRKAIASDVVEPSGGTLFDMKLRDNSVVATLFQLVGKHTALTLLLKFSGCKFVLEHPKSERERFRGNLGQTKSHTAKMAHGSDEIVPSLNPAEATLSRVTKEGLLHIFRSKIMCCASVVWMR